MRKPFAALVSAILVFVAPSPSIAQVEIEPGCQNQQIAEMLFGFDTVQLAAAAGNSIPGDRAAAYRKMEEAVTNCAKRGTRITVRPITEHAMAELPVFAEVVPDKTGENAYNNLHYVAERRKYMQRAHEALNGLPSIGARDKGSDPLGALMVASHELPPNSKAIIVLICNGWQQTRELNVFSYRTDPARFAPVALQNLALHHSLPDLTGIRIVFAGRTTGAAGIHVTDPQLEGLCEFWSTIVEAGHGKMQRGDCTASLPGVTR